MSIPFAECILFQLGVVNLLDVSGPVVLPLKLLIPLLRCVGVDRCVPIVAFQVVNFIICA